MSRLFTSYHVLLASNHQQINKHCMHMQNLLGTIKDDLQKVWNKSNTAVAVLPKNAICDPHICVIIWIFLQI